MDVPSRDRSIDAGMLRQLPPVGAVLEREELAELRAGRGRDALVRAVRAAIGEARTRLRGGAAAAVDAPSLARRAGEILRGERRSLRPVINATGILLHTGPGAGPAGGGGGRGRRRGGPGLLQPRVRARATASGAGGPRASRGSCAS